MNTNNSNPADTDGNYQYTLPLQTTKFAIFGLLQSGQLATRAISIAAELKIADYLKDGPKSIDELSYETSSKEIRHLFYHLPVCLAVFWFRFYRDNYFISIYLNSSRGIEFYFD